MASENDLNTLKRQLNLTTKAFYFQTIMLCLVLLYIVVR